jgi:hypothetical protein
VRVPEREPTCNQRTFQIKVKPEICLNENWQMLTDGFVQEPSTLVLPKFRYFCANFSAQRSKTGVCFAVTKWNWNLLKGFGGAARFGVRFRG